MQSRRWVKDKADDTGLQSRRFNSNFAEFHADALVKCIATSYTSGRMTKFCFYFNNFCDYIKKVDSLGLQYHPNFIFTRLTEELFDFSFGAGRGKCRCLLEISPVAASVSHACSQRLLKIRVSA